MRFNEPWMRQIFFKRVQNRIETFHVANLQGQSVVSGQIRQFASMRGVVSNRLFDQHMFALRKKRTRNRVVGVRGRRHGSGIDHPHEFIQRPGRRRVKLGRNRAVRDRIHIIHRGQLSGRNLRVQSRMIASDMTHPNNANTQIFHPLTAVNARKIRVKPQLSPKIL